MAVSHRDAIYRRPFDQVLDEAIAVHGALCPGTVLGARMAVAGCRELGVDDPRLAPSSLLVVAEIDRCAMDVIQGLTGVRAATRTFWHVGFGKMAATFVDGTTGEGVRVAVRDDARRLARSAAPREPDSRRAQIAAYRTLPEEDLLRIERVTVDPAQLAGRDQWVRCEQCGEGVHDGREVEVGGSRLCRACAGDVYYRPAAPVRPEV